MFTLKPGVRAAEDKLISNKINFKLTIITNQQRDLIEPWWKINKHEVGCKSEHFQQYCVLETYSSFWTLVFKLWHS